MVLIYRQINIITREQEPCESWYWYSREHISAPPSHGSKYPWTQIPSGIDGITAVEAKSGADNKHHQSDHDRSHALVRRIVVAIQNSEDAAHKKSSAK